MHLNAMPSGLQAHTSMCQSAAANNMGMGGMSMGGSSDFQNTQMGPKMGGGSNFMMQTGGCFSPPCEQMGASRMGEGMGMGSGYGMGMGGMGAMGGAMGGGAGGNMSSCGGYDMPQTPACMPRQAQTTPTPPSGASTPSSTQRPGLMQQQMMMQRALMMGTGPASTFPMRTASYTSTPSAYQNPFLQQYITNIINRKARFLGSPSSRKPRHRRSFKELERNIRCKHVGCGRVYATESSLQNHLRLKHNNIRPPDSPMSETKREQADMSHYEDSETGSNAGDLSAFATPLGSLDELDGFDFGRLGLDVSTIKLSGFRLEDLPEDEQLGGPAASFDSFFASQTINQSQMPKPGQWGMGDPTLLDAVLDAMGQKTLSNWVTLADPINEEVLLGGFGPEFENFLTEPAV
eukprot:comp23464_c0_seq1/m.39192 comp23464_c0_seq1/g.39192  ORF comp23464_c0_seq1/g.39192 comp23464_c0_seq1/m.39192 type:complete len:405 (-) comp23464_c0_seq1:442-1656(-)